MLMLLVCWFICLFTRKYSDVCFTVCYLCTAPGQSPSGAGQSPSGAEQSPSGAEQSPSGAEQSPSEGGGPGQTETQPDEGRKRSHE